MKWNEIFNDDDDLEHLVIVDWQNKTKNKQWIDIIIILCYEYVYETLFFFLADYCQPSSSLSSYHLMFTFVFFYLV